MEEVEAVAAAAHGDDIADAVAAVADGGGGGGDSGADSVRHWALPRRSAFAWIVPTRRRRLRRRTAGATGWGAVKPPAKRCRE